MKFGAVTAALACAGGAMVIGHAPSGASAPTVAPVALDHYLCTGSFGHGRCEAAAVSLPDGTSFPVGNPGDRFSCTAERHRGSGQSSVLETNEFSPGGSPVPLAPGRLRATCSILPAVQFPNTRAHATAVPVETFSCSSVHYPSRDSVRFTPPFPVTVNGRSARVLRPWLLCAPSGPQPMLAGATDLVCFTARVAPNSRRFFAEGFGLCVPSSEGTTPAPVDASSSTTTSTTTTTTSTTTTTTTTTRPPTPTSSTTTTTTGPSTPTSSTTTTTTGAPPSSSTTTTTHPQPCAGILVNGVCIINS